MLRIDRPFFWLLLAVLGCSSSSEPPPANDPPAQPVLEVTSEAISARLSWRPATESDFDRYRIYRSRRGTPVTEGEPDPAFPLGKDFEIVLWEEILVASDTTCVDVWVSPGHRYVYALSVVDQGGRESRADSVTATMRNSDQPLVGWEPRRARWRHDEDVELNLWVAGTADLSGLVLEVGHDWLLDGCASSNLFGDGTLFLCQTDPGQGAGETTTVAASSIRGGPVFSGVGTLGTLGFQPPDSGTMTLPISVVAWESADGALPVVLETVQEVKSP